MEQITELLISLQARFEKQSAELNEMKESITKSINKNIDEKFLLLESRQKHLEKITEQQKERIQQLEKNARRKNLVFFGVEEGEKSYLNLQNKIIEKINSQMELKCVQADIEYVTRLGKRSEKIRPIIVTLTTMAKKLEILHNKKLLLNTSYYIREDFPPEIIEERKKLNIQVQQEREKGNKAYIKYNKMVVISDNEQTKNQVKPDRQKGNLTSSPEKDLVLTHDLLFSKNTHKKNQMESCVVKANGIKNMKKKFHV